MSGAFQLAIVAIKFMNITVLLFFALTVAITTVLSIWGSRNLGDLVALLLFPWFGCVSFLIVTLVGSWGAPVIAETTDFLIEKTPYRIIVHAFSRETQFKDAYLVNSVEKIAKIRLTVERNAWGCETGAPVVSIIFKDSLVEKP